MRERGRAPRRASRLVAAAGLLVCSSFWSVPARACPIEDVETPVGRLAAEGLHASEVAQVEAYRERIIAPHAFLFAPGVIGDFEPGAMQSAMLRSLRDARDPERPKTLHRVELALAAAMRRFSALFPDFRCNFPIYFMDTLGRFDGAGRTVGGRPALVLGIDQIARERKFLPLQLFLSHELFHRYHGSVSGFSDDPGERQAIWRSLWAEGLATYASFKMTPGATIDAALIAPPRLAEKAGPLVPAIAGDLLLHLQQPDHRTYALYFTFGNGEAARRRLPWRSGYYLGFLVAKDLGHHRSLEALARLRGPELEGEIEASLRRLARRR